MRLDRLAMAVCGILVSGGCAPDHLTAPAPDASRTVVISREGAMTGEPLFVIDGRVVPRAQARTIDPGQLASVTVLKGQAAIDQYGGDARDGVIIVVTKGNGGSAVVTGEGTARVTVRPGGNSVEVATPNGDRPQRVVVRPSAPVAGPAPLYIVDGVRTPAGRANAIDPSSIREVTVLKGPDAVRRYGDDGRNGVVLITLRHANTLLID